jgi:hypothetical protein
MKKRNAGLEVRLAGADTERGGGLRQLHEMTFQSRHLHASGWPTKKGVGQGA